MARSAERRQGTRNGTSRCATVSLARRVRFPIVIADTAYRAEVRRFGLLGARMPICLGNHDRLGMASMPAAAHSQAAILVERRPVRQCQCQCLWRDTRNLPWLGRSVRYRVRTKQVWRRRCALPLTQPAGERNVVFVYRIVSTGKCEENLWGRILLSTDRPNVVMCKSTCSSDGAVDFQIRGKILRWSVKRA